MNSTSMTRQINTAQGYLTLLCCAAAALGPQIWGLQAGHQTFALWYGRIAIAVTIFLANNVYPKGHVAIPGFPPVFSLLITYALFMLLAYPHDVLGNDVYTLNVIVAVAVIGAGVRYAWSMDLMALPEREQDALAEAYWSETKRAASAGKHEARAARREAKAAEEAAAMEYVVRRARHDFSAVIGMQDLRARLLEAGTAAKAHKGNGILMFSEPGNGKTFLAEALAGQLNLPFLPVTFGSVASKWVNEPVEKIIKVFRDARAQSPCVLFLDEVDTLIPDRGASGSSSEETTKVVNALLTEMVDLRGSGVILIAATNFLDRLDSAAVREGRFDYKIEVPPPDHAARVGLIKEVLAKHRGATMATDALDRIATRWEGFSVARIRTVAEEAITMSQDSREALTPALMMKALRKVQGRAGRLPENTPRIEDLVLADDQREAVLQLATRMIRIDEIEQLGGTVPRGVLFFGPPGNGKTLLAKALAKTTGWGFLAVSGNDLIHDSKLLDKMLREAADIRPCIFFIDEADDVFGERMGNPMGSAITNKLLAAMDGAKGRLPDVVFVAATNHADQFDAAALRGGRFTEKIEFQNPPIAQVETFATDWIKASKMPVSPRVSAAAVASLLVGQSNANIREILQTATNAAAARRVASGDRTALDLEDIADAIRTVTGEEPVALAA